MHAPEARHRLRVDQLEDAERPVRPLDVARAVGGVLQHLQQELPQVGGGACDRGGARRWRGGRGDGGGATPTGRWWCLRQRGAEVEMGESHR